MWGRVAPGEKAWFETEGAAGCGNTMGYGNVMLGDFESFATALVRWRWRCCSYCCMLHSVGSKIFERR